MQYSQSDGSNQLPKNHYLDFVQMPVLISLVNGYHVDNNLGEILVYIYFGSIVTKKVD